MFDSLISDNLHSKINNTSNILLQSMVIANRNAQKAGGIAKKGRRLGAGLDIKFSSVKRGCPLSGFNRV